jgi:peroxiredoxin
MKRALLLLSVFGVAGAALAAEVGKPAPEFTATDMKGQSHALNDYRGKIVVLEAYNLDCPFVRNHYRSGAIQELQRDLTAKGVVWLVVNSVAATHPSHRSPEAARKEWAEQKIAATAWLDDSSGKVGKAYGMKTTPHMYVIDQSGVLAYAGAIDDRAAAQGDPRTARNYVREAVQKLQAGEKLAVSETKPYGCGVKYGS